ACRSSSGLHLIDRCEKLLHLVGLRASRDVLDHQGPMASLRDQNDVASLLTPPLEAVALC
ncbi:MAG: hypothetical protein WEA34_04350, partial [Gemmatimonadota bacterium]